MMRKSKLLSVTLTFVHPSEKRDGQTTYTQTVGYARKRNENFYYVSMSNASNEEPRMIICSHFVVNNRCEWVCMHSLRIMKSCVTIELLRVS